MTSGLKQTAREKSGQISRSQGVAAVGDRYQACIVHPEETERVTENWPKKGVKPGVIVNGMRTVVTGQLAGP